MSARVGDNHLVAPEALVPSNSGTKTTATPADAHSLCRRGTNDSGSLSPVSALASAKQPSNSRWEYSRHSNSELRESSAASVSPRLSQNAAALESILYLADRLHWTTRLPYTCRYRSGEATPKKRRTS